MSLRVHVAPSDSPLAPAAREAVVRGGGRVADPGDAEAVVWLTTDAAGLAPLLADGVRWVQLPSAGVDRWFSSGLIDARRQYSSAGPAYAGTVAEHALCLVLATARSVHVHARAREWRRTDIIVMRDATVAIVGCGRIGRVLIALLRPFGTKVVAINRSGRAVDGAAITVPVDRLVEAVGDVDFVVVAAPLSPATNHLIGERVLAAMPLHAALINVGRGALVDTAALTAALTAGTIRAAALDVTDPEPLPPDHPLWREPRALITPHIANTAEQGGRELLDLIELNTRRVAAGAPPDGLIDHDLGY